MNMPKVAIVPSMAALFFFCATIAVETGARQKPAIPVYYCYRTSGKIHIDGRLDEPSWHSARPTRDFVDARGFKTPAQRTFAKMLWDDDYLYVAFECQDKVVWSIKRARDDSLWYEEVVEVFIDADGDGKNYIELEVNPLNTFLDIYLLWPIKPLRYESWNSDLAKTAVTVDGTVNRNDDTDRGWKVELRFPFRDVATATHRPPRERDSWRLNMYRIDRKPAPEFSAWSPTLGKTFHNPRRFGRVVFVNRSVGSAPIREAKPRKKPRNIPEPKN